ncbi:DUF6841 family protein [Ruegeria jejuensis]|uniref:DUF6841 family protein n=1 Tax=Ruegeria jejuensis TaxID=3233338 RepID=UPI00355BD610
MSFDSAVAEKTARKRMEAGETSSSFDRKAVEEEVRQWFFEEYYPRWVEVGNGTRDEGPEFILEYWGRPMFATHDEPEIATWLKTDEEVMMFLTMQHNILKSEGFTHTYTPEEKVFVYNKNGAAVEGIWSRRRADESEVHRIVVHFELARMGGKWRVVGTQTRMTDLAKDNNTVAGAWAQDD